MTQTKKTFSQLARRSDRRRRRAVAAVALALAAGVQGGCGGGGGWWFFGNDAPAGALSPAPASLTLAAYQVEDKVLVVARGTNTVGGYRTALEMGPERIYPPRFRFVNEPPAADAIVSQGEAPFEAAAWFAAGGLVSQVRVDVDGESVEVPVVRAGLARAGAGG